MRLPLTKTEPHFGAPLGRSQVTYRFTKDSSNSSFCTVDRTRHALIRWQPSGYRQTGFPSKCMTLSPVPNSDDFRDWPWSLLLAKCGPHRPLCQNKGTINKVPRLRPVKALSGNKRLRCPKERLNAKLWIHFPPTHLAR